MAERSVLNPELERQRPDWSTYQVSGQPVLRSESLFLNINKRSAKSQCDSAVGRTRGHPVRGRVVLEQGEHLTLLWLWESLKDGCQERLVVGCSA